MGRVYTPYAPALDRKVALKLLRHAGADGDARLFREARAMAKLNHPNVAHVYDVGGYQERVFVAMELVAGHTLRDWLREPRQLPAVLDAFIQAGRGLDAAHQVGIVHRDFKPENAMIDGGGRVRVLDFGL